MLRESPALSIHDVVADEVLECAYRWLCERRKFYPDAADIWTFRHGWSGERERLRQELMAGTYRFGLLAATASVPWAPPPLTPFGLLGPLPFPPFVVPYQWCRWAWTYLSMPWTNSCSTISCALVSVSYMAPLVSQSKCGL
jgi:hypothetical protein